MPTVCGVRFRGSGKVYHFAPGDLQDLQPDERVVVETARGIELGEVAMPAQEVADEDLVGELKPVLRRATESDLAESRRFRARETSATETCRRQAARLGLDMKVVSAEYSFDGSRLTFFFTAEQRVDFRELVRELARDFRTRIELRQVGVRDEARMVGGLGKCGRTLCCATWLADFSPVSIRMAKQQDLPLSPMEISGLCGRLLCCLGYENDYYKDVKDKFPKVGKVVDTPAGQGKAVKICVLRETVTFLLEDGTTVDMTADQLAGTEPLDRPRQGRSGLTAAQESALDASIGGRRTEPAPRSGRRPRSGEHSSDDGWDRAGQRPRQRPTAGGSLGTEVTEPQAAQLPRPSSSAENALEEEGAHRARRRRPRRRSGSHPLGDAASLAAQGEPGTAVEGRPPAQPRNGSPREEDSAPAEGAPERRRRPRSRRRHSRSETSAPAQDA